MNHKCQVTVIRKECFEDLQQEYLADPKSGVCPIFEVGEEFVFDGTSYESMNGGKFCMEAWDAINRYVYAALQFGSIMQGWTSDEKVMIACCNDRTRTSSVLL